MHMTRLLARVLLGFFCLFLDQSLQSATRYCTDFLHTLNQLPVRDYFFERQVYGPASEYEMNLHIPKEVIERYEQANRLKFDTRLDEGLFQFLERHNLEKEKLFYLESGIQGTIFLHPGLPGRAIKVWNTAVNPPLSEQLLRDLPGNFDMRAPDWSLRLHKPGFFSSNEARMNYEKSYYQAKIMRESLLPRTSILQAAKLMRLGLFMDELKLPYLSAVRVHGIGNYFMIRDFQNDGVIGRSVNELAVSVAAASGLDFGGDGDEIAVALSGRPDLRSIFAYFSGGQVYCSKKEFCESLKFGKPRLKVIFDMD